MTNDELLREAIQKTHDGDTWTIDPSPEKGGFADAVVWLAMNEESRAAEIERSGDEIKHSTHERMRLASACCRADGVLRAAWASADRAGAGTREERCVHVRAFVDMVMRETRNDGTRGHDDD